MKQILVVIACLCLALLTARTVGRPEAGEFQASVDLPDNKDEIVIRAYDIRCLVRLLSERDPDPEVHGDLFAMPSALPNQSEINVASQIEGLLIDNIEADSWYANGGAEGEIRYADGLLVVRQTTRNQAKVAALLDKLHRIATRPRAVQSPLLE